MPLIQLHAQVVLALHSAVEAFGPFAFDALSSLPSKQVVLKSLGNHSNRPVHGWITAQLMVLMGDLFFHPRFQVCDGGCNLSCGY